MGPSRRLFSADNSVSDNPTEQGGIPAEGDILMSGLRKVRIMYKYLFQSKYQYNPSPKSKRKIMKRIEIKEKLDEILRDFNPKDYMYETFTLGNEEYELIIDTVWQLSQGLDESDRIRPKQLKEGLKGDDNRKKILSKILLLLLKGCGLYDNYKHCK